MSILYSRMKTLSRFSMSYFHIKGKLSGLRYVGLFQTFHLARKGILTSCYRIKDLLQNYYNFFNLTLRKLKDNYVIYLLI